LSHNLHELSATQTCDPVSDYTKSVVVTPNEETSTAPMDNQGQARHVIVDSRRKTVVIDYDAAAEQESRIRKKIADLLKR